LQSVMCNSANVQRQASHSNIWRHINPLEELIMSLNMRANEKLQYHLRP
jgi:hypothetical protein